jgi:hypothetical protein
VDRIAWLWDDMKGNPQTLRPMQDAAGQQQQQQQQLVSTPTAWHRRQAQASTTWNAVMRHREGRMVINNRCLPVAPPSAANSSSSSSRAAGGMQGRTAAASAIPISPRANFAEMTIVPRPLPNDSKPVAVAHGNGNKRTSMDLLLARRAATAAGAEEAETEDDEEVKLVPRTLGKSPSPRPRGRTPSLRTIESDGSSEEHEQEEEEEEEEEGGTSTESAQPQTVDPRNIRLVLDHRPAAGHEEPEVLRQRRQAIAKGNVLGTQDTIGDGRVDTLLLDTTGDGKADVIGYDTTGDGKIDSYDTTGDGKIDAVDTTGDGIVDSVDTVGDGKLDTAYISIESASSIGSDLDKWSDQSKSPKDESEVLRQRRQAIAKGNVLGTQDTIGDGRVDTLLLDTTGDGKADVIGYDTTGDGKIDSYDTTGDGKIDAVDTTGDGAVDSVDQPKLAKSEQRRLSRRSSSSTLCVGALHAQSQSGQRVESLFDLFKHICRTRAVDRRSWEQHGRLHARLFYYFHTNTHPYYLREGLWLSREERATLGTLHLCYATTLFRAWQAGGGGGGGGADGASTAAAAAASEQQGEQEGQATAAAATAAAVCAARAQADAVPAVVELRLRAAAAAAAAGPPAAHEHGPAASLAEPQPQPQPPPAEVAARPAALKKWAAARDAATVLFLWCGGSGSAGRERGSRGSSKGGGGVAAAAALEREQLMGGARRFALVRERPDGRREKFAAVASEEEALQLQPDYMQDKGYAMGQSYVRVDDGSYRFGHGGRFVGHQPLRRHEKSHWQRSAAETVQAVLTRGEASMEIFEQLIEIARKSCLTEEEGHVDAVRRPSHPFWRPFWLRFTYVTSVLVKKFLSREILRRNGRGQAIMAASSGRGPPTKAMVSPTAVEPRKQRTVTPPPTRSQSERRAATRSSGGLCGCVTRGKKRR